MALVLTLRQRANDLATIALNANQTFHAVKTALAQHCEFAFWISILAMREAIAAPDTPAIL
jgi:hypothetical protein